VTESAWARAKKSERALAEPSAVSPVLKLLELPVDVLLAPMGVLWSTPL
jgi:hypothetical protein